MRPDGRIYEAPVGRLLEIMQEVEPRSALFCSIGHNPGLRGTRQLAYRRGRQGRILRLGQKYPTAGLAVIDFDWRAGAMSPRNGRLERFVTPKFLGNGEDD